MNWQTIGKLYRKRPDSLRGANEDVILNRAEKLRFRGSFPENQTDEAQ